MSETLPQLALVVAASFTGAAVYVPAAMRGKVITGPVPLPPRGFALGCHLAERTIPCFLSDTKV